MGEVLVFPRPALNDGGKARILRHRARSLAEPITADDLRMDHVDNGMPSDSAYVELPDDCA